MPSKLRAGGLFPYILIEDRGDCTDCRYNLRVLSCDDNAMVLDLRNEYVAAKDPKQRNEVFRSILDLCVDDAASVTSVLTERECWELIGAAIEGAALTADERKKFLSPPPSETENSADDAAAASVATE